MANIKQAKKRIRRNGRRTIINKDRLSMVRTQIKKVESAVEAGDKKAANEALQIAQPQIDRGVAKGLFHRNTASRKLSRLSKRIAALK